MTVQAAAQKFKRINIEISNICNLKCSFCPSGERDKQVMSVADFDRLAGEVAGLTEEVVLHLLGEPLGHPEFARILDACDRVGVRANIVTNGVLMTGGRPAELLRPIVRQVSFSLHSFEDNFKHQDPEVYFRRIANFIERAEAERPDLYINLRLWDLDGVGADDTARNSKMRDLLASNFGFDWTDVKVDLRRRKNWRIRGRIYLHFDSRFEWPRMDLPVQGTKGFCQGLTGHVGIHADGTVVPCCLDHKADMPLGNVHTTPMREILAGPRATAMRLGFQRGELVEPLCQRCTFISRFDHQKRPSGDTHLE